MSIPDSLKRRVTTAHADRIALGLADRDLTYSELDLLSDQVAHAVSSECGARPEPVALLLEQDAPVPPAMLGVVKAGKFYVPLDPSYPLERNRYVLHDTGARVLITNNRNISLAASLGGRDCRLINLDDAVSRFTGDYAKTQSKPDDLV